MNGLYTLGPCITTTFIPIYLHLPLVPLHLPFPPTPFVDWYFTVVSMPLHTLPTRILRWFPLPLPFYLQWLVWTCHAPTFGSPFTLTYCPLPPYPSPFATDYLPFPLCLYPHSHSPHVLGWMGPPLPPPRGTCAAARVYLPFPTPPAWHACRGPAGLVPHTCPHTPTAFLRSQLIPHLCSPLTCHLLLFCACGLVVHALPHTPYLG